MTSHQYAPKSKSRQRKRAITGAAKTLSTHAWSRKEALLVFLSTSASPPEWPTFNDKLLWNEASNLKKSIGQVSIRNII